MPQRPRNLRDEALHELVETAPRALARLVGVDGEVVRARAQVAARASRRADAVLEVCSPEGERSFVHVEFKSRPGPGIGWRMLLYHVLLRARPEFGGSGERPAPRFRSVLVLVGRFAGEVPDRIEVEDGPTFAWEVVRLDRRPARELARDPLLAPLTPLGADVDERALEDAARAIRNAENPERYADILLKCAAASGGDALERLAREAMARATTRVEDMLTYREGRARGLEEGRARGLEEGRARGLEEGLRLACADAVRARFPDVDGERLDAALSGLGPPELQRALRRVVSSRARTAKELLAELRAG